MPITQEQTNLFSNSLPLSLKVPDLVNNGILFKGREALVKQLNPGSALKWYALLSNNPVDQLVRYAAEVNQDEADLLNAGFAKQQVPNSHFFIDTFSSGDYGQLFAIQRWIEGKPLKDLSLKEIIKNPELRESIAGIFTNAARIFQQTKKYINLIKKNQIQIGRHSFQDPRKVISPFRSPNIMIEGNNAVLVDAKKLTFKPDDYRYQVAGFHQALSLFVAYALKNL
jgi:hypothetical protein